MSFSCVSSKSFIAQFSSQAPVVLLMLQPRSPPLCVSLSRPCVVYCFYCGICRTKGSTEAGVREHTNPRGHGPAGLHPPAGEILLQPTEGKRQAAWYQVPEKGRSSLHWSLCIAHTENQGINSVASSSWYSYPCCSAACRPRRKIVSALKSPWGG